MRLNDVRNQRGNVLLFVAGFLLLMLVMGGAAVDLAYYMTVDDELQRAMDSAALAGAGNLGFDDTVFPTARQAAANYAALNPYRNVSGASNTLVAPALNLNTANAPEGNIVLGIWDPTASPKFTPSLDGTRVNAVRCQMTAPLPTTFLRLIGINSLTSYAQAIAIANPPAAPPADACLFPIGLGDCPFQQGGQGSSVGCGVPISFITSSGKEEDGIGCISPPCTNTGSWVSLDGSGTPTPPDIAGWINAAAAGNCQGSPLETGDNTPVNNGMLQSAYDVLYSNPNQPTKEPEGVFVDMYNQSGTHEVKDSQGNIVYSGKGWSVYVPVLHSETCPPGPFTGSPQIVGWTKFVITQVINKGVCAVSNHNPANNDWDPAGAPGRCTGTNYQGNAARGIFGYYECDLQPANPVPIPVPRAALAQRLRLVQ